MYGHRKENGTISKIVEALLFLRIRFKRIHLYVAEQMADIESRAIRPPTYIAWQYHPSFLASDFDHKYSEYSAKPQRRPIEPAFALLFVSSSIHKERQLYVALIDNRCRARSGERESLLYVVTFTGSRIKIVSRNGCDDCRQGKLCE